MASFKSNKWEAVHPEDVAFYYPRKKRLAEEVFEYCRRDLNLPADAKLGFMVRADVDFASRLRWHGRVFSYKPDGKNYGGIMDPGTRTAFINIFLDIEDIPRLVGHEAWHLHEFYTGVPYDEAAARAYGQKVAERFGGPVESRQLPMERRTVAATTARAVMEGGKKKIRGYAVVWDAVSVELGGGFTESFARGAFRKSLEGGQVIKALWNHNSDMPLGSTANKTLVLREDDYGLWYEITPPATTWARDALEAVASGLVDGTSFGFITVKDEWGTRNGKRHRTVLEAKLLEISPTPFPAYGATTAEAASTFSRRSVDLDLNELKAALYRRKINHRATRERDYWIIRQAITALENLKAAAR
jgi:HK97 family phage prohead protease